MERRSERRREAERGGKERGSAGEDRRSGSERDATTHGGSHNTLEGEARKHGR